MGLSIALVGNCQVGNLAGCVRALLPDARVFIVMLEKARRGGDCAALADRAAACDIVLSQEVTAEAFGPLRSEALAARGRPFALYPKVLFTGFHPDCHGLFDADGRSLQSPLGAYHSEILLCAFLAGLELDEALQLFVAETYQRLGYFRQYGKARDYLLSTAGALGYALEGEMDAWLAHGPFMHSFNHPTPRVMGSIARLALARLDIATPEADFGAVEDRLAVSARWPVYPEIGERIGLPANPFAFTRAMADGGEALSLEDFAARCYAAYPATPAEVLTRGVHAARLETVTRLGERLRRRG